MNLYPLMLNVKGKKAVVVGGGKVASRKIRSLTESGADVTVISPTIHENIEIRVQKNEVHWHQKYVELQDFQEAFIVIAATNDPDINKYVAFHTSDKQLVNIVDQPELGNFQVPAKLNRGKLTITVSTGGSSPRLAKKIRDDLMTTYDDSYEHYVNALSQCREQIKNMPVDEQVRKQLFEKCERNLAKEMKIGMEE